MDIMSVLGILVAFGLMLMGMTTQFTNFGQLTNFVDIPSVAITIGGTFAALMITFPLKTFMSLPKYLLKIFLPQKFNPQTYINEIIEIAFDARKNSLLSLEDKIPQYKDDFLKKGVQLAVDSVESEMIREIMETELGFMIERHKKGVLFFEKGAALAPGFGMIGTLVGLINMLAGMEDPDALMGNMAVALITTFYGSLLANIIFIPMAIKLGQRSDEEVLCKQIIIEGVISIVNGEGPKQIQEKLVSYIPPALRNLDKDKEKKEESGGEASGS